MSLRGRRRKLLFGAKGVVFDTTINPPIIYSSASVNCDEGATLAYTLTANESVTWTKVGGADQGKFEISGNTLRWLSNGVKDYETPDDADLNNTYVVTIRATDLQAQTTDKTITVTVVDVTGVSPAAPFLDLTSDNTDLTPDFTLTGDIAEGDTVRFQYSTSAVFSGASEITNTIDAAEDAANMISFSTGSLAAGTWYFRARIERPEAVASGWSNTETITFVTPYDTATTAWIDAVVTAGGAVSTTQKDRVDALIVGLKADGLFSANSRLWIHAGESDAKQATIDLMGLAVSTLTAAPTLNASGYLGNGTSTFINYGTTPSNHVQDSCSFGAYCSSASSTTPNNDVIMGRLGSGIFMDLLPMFHGTLGGLVRLTGGLMSGGDNRRGLFIGSRRSATDQEFYINGASVTSDAGTSGTQPTNNYYGLARNDDGTATSFSNDRIAAAWIGGGLTDTQAINLSSRINTYMTAWGITYT